MKLPSPIARSQALAREIQNASCARRKSCNSVFGQGFDSPRLHHSAQIRTRKAIFRNSICAHIQNSGRVKPPLFCCFGLHIKGEILGYPDFTFIFICASAKSRGAVFFIYIRARTREGCFLSLKMNEIHKKFALTNGNPGSAPPCLIKAPSRQNCRQERRES